MLLQKGPGTPLTCASRTRCLTDIPEPISLLPPCDFSVSGERGKEDEQGIENKGENSFLFSIREAMNYFHI